jgi:DNA-directed RNA polymerase subunit K/omega
MHEAEVRGDDPVASSPDIALREFPDKTITRTV